MAKGSQFERDIAKKLSKWWSRNLRDDIFWRTQNSGGRATTRLRSNKRTEGQHGDLSATDPSGQALLDVFSIELKKGYNKDCLLDLIESKSRTGKPQAQKFIDQAQRQAKEAGSIYWMLIWRRDNRSIMAAIPFKAFKRLNIDPESLATIKTGSTSKIAVMLLDEFLELVKRPDIKKLRRT